MGLEFKLSRTHRKSSITASAAIRAALVRATPLRRWSTLTATGLSGGCRTLWRRSPCCGSLTLWRTTFRYRRTGRRCLLRSSLWSCCRCSLTFWRTTFRCGRSCYRCRCRSFGRCLPDGGGQLTISVDTRTLGAGLANQRRGIAPCGRAIQITR